MATVLLTQSMMACAYGQDNQRLSALMDDVLSQLQLWYARQCDGDWEHQYGVKVNSLDNPGWRVTIDLAGTDLEGRTFEPIERGLADDASTDWYSLSVKESKFEGAGDPSKLAFILRTFLDWAERPGR
jgi:hypothetical protein